MKSLTESETATPCPYLSQLKPYNGQETFESFLIEHYALMAMNPTTIEAIEVESKGIEGGFSYSAYLDSPKDKGTQE